MQDSAIQQEYECSTLNLRISCGPRRRRCSSRPGETAGQTAEGWDMPKLLLLESMLLASTFTYQNLLLQGPCKVHISALS